MRAGSGPTASGRKSLEAAVLRLVVSLIFSPPRKTVVQRYEGAIKLGPPFHSLVEAVNDVGWQRPPQRSALLRVCAQDLLI